MTSHWRKFVEARGARVTNSGSWAKQAALLYSASAGSGSWKRRLRGAISGGGLTGASWARRMNTAAAHDTEAWSKGMLTTARSPLDAVPGGGVSFGIAGTQLSSNAATTTHSFTIPGTPVIGDILIMLRQTILAGGTDATIDNPVGWTPANVALQKCMYAVYDGTQVLSYTSTASATSRIQVIRISGGPVAVAAAGASGTSSDPNPPSVNPSWSAALNTLWVVGAVAALSSFTSSVVPTNYTENLLTTFTVILPNLVHSASRTLAADSEDPGVFNTTPNAIAWQAATFAIQPPA